MQQKIVITGAPGTGKTSIINQLEQSGFFCYHEIIRDFTLEAKKSSTSDNFISNPLNFVDDPLAFNIKILNGRIEQFVKSSHNTDKVVFFDRAVPDVLAYMDFFNQKYDKLFTDACKNNTYSKVFLLPPWEEIYVSDNERLESFEEAKQIHYHLEHTYRNFGYDLNMVPLASVEERVDFIMRSISNE